MAQELKIRVGLDSTRLFAGLRGVQGALASSVGSIARIASRAGAALAAIGAPLTAGAFAVGIKNALDLGGALSDMAARTGIAAGELIVLQQAFKDSGLSAEQVGSSINRMQRSLFDASKGLAEPISGLDAMGLEIDELLGLSPSEQFQKISQAISKIEDPTIRTAAAMKIFGKSGAELGAFFANPKAFEDAQRRLGSQAAILGKNADRFDAVSDTFGAIGVKIRGFFVGVADKILPSLEKIAAVLDSIDLAPIGQKFGESLQKAANILTNAFRTPAERVAEIERQIAGLQDKRVKLQTEGDTDGLDALNAKLADLESRKLALGIDVDVDAVVILEREILELERQRIELKAVGDVEGLKNIDAEINRLGEQKIELNADTSRFETIGPLITMAIEAGAAAGLNFLSATFVAAGKVLAAAIKSAFTSMTVATGLASFFANIAAAMLKIASLIKAGLVAAAEVFVLTLGNKLFDGLPEPVQRFLFGKGLAPPKEVPDFAEAFSEEFDATGTTQLADKIEAQVAKGFQNARETAAQELTGAVADIANAIKSTDIKDLFGATERFEKLKTLLKELNIPLAAVEAAAKKSAGASEEAAEAVSETEVKTTAGRAPEADQFAKIGLFASGGAANAMTDFMRKLANAGRRTNELLSGTLTVKTTGPTFAVAES